MSDRDAVITECLHQAGYGDWTRAFLTGDASARKYFRLNKADQSLILMDAPPETGEKIEPFLRIAAHLRAIGVRAPRIDLADAAVGLVVMEDFGDEILARRLEHHPKEEVRHYSSATEIICRLQDASPPDGLAPLDAQAGAALVEDVAAWCPGLDTTVSPLKDALSHFASSAGVMALRDYHAENLICLDREVGVGSLGVLDFQDAVVAHPVYDLVSLLRDVRRDVGQDAEQAAFAVFLSRTEYDADTLRLAFAAQAVQRNLRILGIFERLARRDGKTRYRAFLPRLHAHLQRDLSHPELTELRQAVMPVLENHAHDA